MPTPIAFDYDVAIIGGGPGGSTTGTLLKKYNPALRVLILEREQFPRDHIGESQLPPIGRVLAEMGAWDKVEAAGFPIKFGATYTWGKTTEPWTFGFIPREEIPADHKRPAPFAGWRTRVALQVDRAQYDDILLRHAADSGCEVRQATKVVEVERTDGTVTGLRLEDGQRVTARYYVDASGNAAVLRRAMGIRVDAPTLLRNVAFWDYWSAPGLNEQFWHNGATRIHIRSLPFGWVWYIALSIDRTSVGVVCPAEYYKTCGKRPEQLYHEALQSDPLVVGMLGAGRARGQIDSTTDWSFIADTTYGPNWFLVGEALGFADPILSAGMTLTHTCGRHCAYTILELDRGAAKEPGAHRPEWLLGQYDTIQRKRVMQHIKFADYWYSANGLFSAIQENCSQIAKASGILLNPDDAFRWLSNGGIDDNLGQFAIGGLDLAGIRQVQWRFSHNSGGDVRYIVSGKNVFKLNLTGATKSSIADLRDGRIVAVPAYVRGDQTLPLVGAYSIVFEALKKTSDAERLLGLVQQGVLATVPAAQAENAYNQAMQCLEAMASTGWVACSLNPGRPALHLESPREGAQIYTAVNSPRHGPSGPGM